MAINVVRIDWINIIGNLSISLSNGDRMTLSYGKPMIKRFPDFLLTAKDQKKFAVSFEVVSRFLSLQPKPSVVGHLGINGETNLFIHDIGGESLILVTITHIRDNRYWSINTTIAKTDWEFPETCKFFFPVMAV